MPQFDRNEALLAYRVARPNYEALSSRLKSLFEDLCSSLKVHVVTGRAKDEDSFRSKSLRLAPEGSSYLYGDPLTEIEDLAGVRIICFSNSQVNEVCELIQDNLCVIEAIDKARELNAAGRVGYVSKHFVVRVGSPRAELPEYAPFAGLKCELQVRTVFQHAWAEVEHRLQYKDDSPKPELRARFQALAGLVQIADREFDQLFELDKQLSERIKDAVQDVTPLDEALDQQVNDETSHKLSAAAGLFGRSPKELVSLGEYQKAIRTYDELISLQPRQSWHYVGRSKAKLLNGDLSGALADLDEITRIGGTDGRLMDVQGRLREAIESSRN